MKTLNGIITYGQSEDIKKCHYLIQSLAKVQEEYYQTLVEELGLNNRGGEYLFDFLFNQPEDKEGFDSYLQRLKIDAESIFKKGVIKIGDNVKVLARAPLRGREGEVIAKKPSKKGLTVFLIKEKNSTYHDFYEEELEVVKK
jgi:hypothetical protein